jgi:cobalt/nickel transport system permease protein
VLAAAIFAGQMLNFSVTGGTSGHLMGAALATIIVGPWAAILVMTSVVSVQALIFQDGGLLVLGANIFNMGILSVMVSSMAFQLIGKFFKNKRASLYVGSFLSGWLSVFIASLLVAFELAFSGTSPIGVALPAMAGVHALIGIGEGLITVGAVTLVHASRRDLLHSVTAAENTSRGIVIGGLVLTLLLVVISPLASSHPDGLEWVAEKTGFLFTAQEAPYAIIPDYAVPGLQNEALATIVAGLIGAVIVFGIMAAVARQKKGQVLKEKIDFES